MTIDCSLCKNTFDAHIPFCPHCLTINMKVAKRKSLLQAECDGDEATVRERMQDMRDGVIVNII